MTRRKVRNGLCNEFGCGNASAVGSIYCERDDCGDEFTVDYEVQDAYDALNWTLNDL